MVFLKPEALRQLQVVLRQVIAMWSPLIKVLQCMVRLYLLKKDLQARLHLLVRVQSHSRKLKACGIQG